MVDISYKGLRRLNTLQIQYVKNLSEQEFKKIRRDFKDCTMFVDVKKQEKAGNRFKFSYHIRVESPNTILTAKQSDWDALKALHKVFDNLKSEVTHKFKKEATRRRTKKF
ncbi:hypothetical protein HOD38_03850 [archaeon]|jgi:ribosome-associated translation inhibitor RaiA|nr:hypothetical protein [archaeon]MBT4397375.1 hypothetical protein [archaeon]MBT4440755.1 hypothetical protein [archaeon]